MILFYATTFQLLETQKMPSWMRETAKIKREHPRDSTALKVWAYMLSSKVIRGNTSIVLPNGNHELVSRLFASVGLPLPIIMVFFMS